MKREVVKIHKNPCEVANLILTQKNIQPDPQNKPKRSSLPGEDLNLWAGYVFSALWYILGTDVTTWFHHHFLLPQIRAINEISYFSRGVTSTMVFGCLLHVTVNSVCLAFYSLLQGLLKYSVEKPGFAWQDRWGQLPAFDLLLTLTVIAVSRSPGSSCLHMALYI